MCVDPNSSSTFFFQGCGSLHSVWQIAGIFLRTSDFMCFRRTSTLITASSQVRTFVNSGCTEAVVNTNLNWLHDHSMIDSEHHLTDLESQPSVYPNYIWGTVNYRIPPHMLEFLFSGNHTNYFKGLKKANIPGNFPQDEKLNASNSLFFEVGISTNVVSLPSPIPSMGRLYIYPHLAYFFW